MEPEKFELQIGEHGSVTWLLYQADKKQRTGVTIILGHGAGAGQLHPFMTLFARGLAERGCDTVTFNFLYMEQKRKVPDPKGKLEQCYRAVIEAVSKERKLKGNRLVIGGKSMGGRIASQVAAEGETAAEVSALVFLGYPLHPPGRPDKLRDAHLPDIKVPMLFVQGSRDTFGTAEELEVIVQRHHLNATLHIVAGGDHSLKVPKSGGVSQQQVYENAMNEIARWLH